MNASTEVTIQKSALPSMAMSETDLIGVLSSSLYPGAAKNSILMVLSYCKATGLDPMQKPVHIVPMWDKNSKAMRDVVMPGIGLYRTQAARSGQYAGVTEPEFGADVTEDIGGVPMTYPRYCKVSVKRLMANGSIVEFTATEFWKENYATAGKDSIAPNAMWKKRPYGQVAKCAEAQALRKAFPEFGSQPTADEMEGKAMDDSGTIDVTPRQTAPSEKIALPVMDKDEVITRYGSDIIDGDSGEVTKFSKRSLIEQGEAKAQTLIDFLASRCALTEEAIEEIKSWEKK
ncbi:MAG: phage recombination protein Bet [Gallionella sp.]